MRILVVGCEEDAASLHRPGGSTRQDRSPASPWAQDGHQRPESTWPGSLHRRARFLPGRRLYGAVRVRARAGSHPEVQEAHADRGGRGPRPIVVGTLVSVEVERLPHGQRRRSSRGFRGSVVARSGREPDPDLPWRAYVRRFDLPEHTFRLLSSRLWDGPPHGSGTPRSGRDRWTWLVVGFTRLRAWHERAWPTGDFLGRGATPPAS